LLLVGLFNLYVVKWYVGFLRTYTTINQTYQ
jgi:hypothetical protein